MKETVRSYAPDFCPSVIITIEKPKMSEAFLIFFGKIFSESIGGSALYFILSHTALMSFSEAPSVLERI